MNYRHAFHAGNFADVLKHAVLVWIIRYLQAKPKAIRILDTHAGTGRYDLRSDEARRTGEWLTGIGRLLGPDAPQVPAALRPLLSPYLDLVRQCQPTSPDELAAYPGSPLLSLLSLRDVDRLQLNELHTEDHLALRQAVHHDRRVTVMNRDGWEVLRAALPPVERRGLVLIDPPFEARDESERIVAGVADGLERFKTGVFIVWYPVKDQRQTKRLIDGLAGVLAGPALRAEIDIGAALSPATGLPRLGRSGLFITNPPYGLDTLLATTLPSLAEHLAVANGQTSLVEVFEPTKR